MAQIRVRLDLTERADTDAGSVVHLVVRDTSVADELHPTVAEASVTLEEADASEVVVDVADDALALGRHYSLFAHVDRSGDGTIDSGDMITTQNVPVTRADASPDAEPIRAAVRRI